MSQHRTVEDLALRARRICLLAEFIGLGPESAGYKKELIMRLYQAEIISDIATEILIETLGLEAA